MTITGQPLMGSYERRVLELLRDRKPHSLHELDAISHYPHAWVQALREDGYRVEEQKGTVVLSPNGR